MKLEYLILPLVALLTLPSVAMSNCVAMLDHEFRKLHSSKSLNLCDVTSEAKAILVVNTASHCGFTGQFEGLEALYQTYGDRGLAVVGFPSNDFRQESSDESKTAEVCYVNYGVTFPMTAPIMVKGESAHPLFKALAAQTKSPSWNFNKYLVDPKSQTVTHYGSLTKPNSGSLTQAIEALL